jgi:hypothetical protein
MKIKTSNFTRVTIKAFFISTIIVFAFANFTKCDAQAIVGKWNEVSVKQFFTPEGVKQTGKSVIEGQPTSTDKVELEFKSDHTYTEFAGHIKMHTVTGTWSVSGNQLTMVATAQKRAGQGSRIYTFSITGNTMIRTMMVQPPYNEIVYKTEDTSIRM